MAEEGLQVRVNVDLVVAGVLVKVQPGRIGHVRVHETEFDRVSPLSAEACTRELNPVPRERHTPFHLLNSIDRDIGDALSLEVQKERLFFISTCRGLLELELDSYGATIAGFFRLIEL